MLDVCGSSRWGDPVRDWTWEGGLPGGINRGAGPKRYLIFKVMKLNEFTEARVLFLLSVHFSSEDLLVGQEPSRIVCPMKLVLFSSQVTAVCSYWANSICHAILQLLFKKKRCFPLQLDQFLLGQDHVLFASVASVPLLRDEVNQRIFKWSGPASWGWERAACFSSALVLEGKCLPILCFLLRQSENWV